MDEELEREEGFFNAKDHLRLYWRIAVPQDRGRVKAHVVLLHGYCDHTGRWREFFTRLARAGHAVHGYDFRGHGQSDGRRGHVDAFDQYLDDLTTFLERVRPRLDGRKLFVVGHSQGGLVMVRHALARPDGIAGVLLSAPYFRLALKPPAVKVAAAKLIGRVLPWLPFKNEIESPMLSRDVEWQRATDRDTLYNRVVTPRWFTESNAAQDEALRRASEFVLPSLVLAAGDDPVTSTATSREFFERITARDKTYKEYPGMRHEILNEIGKDQVYADLLRWLDERA